METDIVSLDELTRVYKRIKDYIGGVNDCMVMLGHRHKIECGWAEFEQNNPAGCRYAVTFNLCEDHGDAHLELHTKVALAVADIMNFTDVRAWARGVWDVGQRKWYDVEGKECTPGMATSYQLHIHWERW